MALAGLQAWWRGLLRPPPPCFHCGDPVRQAVQLHFAGANRLLCCHGCAAVLTAVQAAGQEQAYLAHKNASPPVDS
ncbi:heavy metal translocating P-type ATPase metal-binding domain-containing protein [Massilia sp. W12]|uniref:heavy metal translocating P-type ATPase metal-binding domain-containing protein n=1 Tax=Massilia sp. W12 TaxID=3126507 RepID=UPI0030CC63DA